MALHQHGQQGNTQQGQQGGQRGGQGLTPERRQQILKMLQQRLAAAGGQGQPTADRRQQLAGTLEERRRTFVPQQRIRT